ncbi:MAG: 50S ribosomal protein L28 [Brumimicrobium sp.]|nr:50S ribosomal protein L28 [Brumimicrobium sp.]MCO5269088.1 50S ribosomal protein L28 [Brumimicrobium sp.]
MSRVCQLTGKKVMGGNNVSHSNIKMKRKFYPNLVKKTFFLPEENKSITLQISVAAMRTVNKKGITACVKEARAKGYLNQ